MFRVHSLLVSTLMSLLVWQTNAPRACAYEYLWDEAGPPSTVPSSAALTQERMVTLTDVGWLDEMESGLWTGRIGALLLTRSSPSPDTILFDTNNGGDVLNADEFIFPISGSVDLAFRWHGQIADIDLRY